MTPPFALIRGTNVRPAVCPVEGCTRSVMYRTEPQTYVATEDPPHCRALAVWFDSTCSEHAPPPEVQ